MRIVVAAIAALALAVALAGDTGAQAQPEKMQKSAKHRAKPAAPARAVPRETDGYIERNADKLPFGSQVWWDQMLRENRAGTCCN